MTAVPKQQAVLTKMWRYLQTAPEPQALLLFGDSAPEHEVLITTLVATLFCKNVDLHEEVPQQCGQCPSCKKLLSGNHPDFTVLKSNASEAINIETVRRFMTLFGYHPFLQNRRFGVILNADRLTPSASSALLKLIEEPPAKTAILLSCRNYLQLLPTIRSRAIPVHIPARTGAENESAEIRSVLGDVSIWERVATLNLSENIESLFTISEELSKNRNLGLAFLKAGKIFFSGLLNGCTQESRDLWRFQNRWTRRECSEILLAFELASKHLEYNTHLRLIIEQVLVRLARPMMTCI